MAERALDGDVGHGDHGGPVAAHHESVFGPAARRLEERVQALREMRRKARRDLRVLLRVPPEERPDKIFSARSRYRNRAFAELLLEETRRRVKDDPEQARQLAALVPEVLHWVPGAGGRPWRLALETLGRAHEANALRVAGDLVAAHRAFTALRRDLAAVPAVDPRVAGEVAGLEAALRSDQRRFAEVAELLDQALLLHRRAGDRDGEVRTLIQQATLARQQERHEDADGKLRRAIGLVDPEEQTNLYVHILGSRALCLCDLGRFDEAEAIFDADRERFEAVATRWSRLLVLGARGRIALGRGDHAAAEEAFTGVHRGAMELGRDLDAVLAAVDLAQVYLEQARHDELCDLAAGLLVSFRSRGVGREALAAVRLLHEAVTSAELDRARLRRIRRRLLQAVPRRS